MPTLGYYSGTLTYKTPVAVFVTQQNITKSLATETITIAEASHVRVTVKARLLANQTITLGETINRIKAEVKTVSDTTTIAGEAIAKLITKIRALSATEAIAEGLANLISKVRALAAQTTTIAEDIDMLVNPTIGAAIEKSLSESEIIAELSIRLKAVWRLQP